MVECAAITYGVATSFVLNSLGRNRRENRASPEKLVYAGYVLCGVSAAGAALFSGVAVGRLIG
jgi:hypothetical protein